MTAQEHIEAIGRAMVKSEEALKAIRKALRLAEEHHALLHARLERVQADYIATHGGENVVPFSGGTNKPPVDDPDGPVRP
jgi:hypothetical protein